MNRRFAEVMALAAFAVPAATGAQTSCTWSANDAWVKRQAEFFDESKHDWTNDSLRTALLAAAGLAPPLNAPVSLGVWIEGREKPLGRGADTVIAQLKRLASQRGSTWPTRSVVGAAGAHALYVLAQHDSVLLRTIHRFMEAGPSEAPAVDVAVWEDRLRVLAGRKQIYGTQFRTDAQGKIVLAPMEDSGHADLRREDAGLPPFGIGRCVAQRGGE
jgi:hypothetical protein